MAGKIKINIRMIAIGIAAILGTYALWSFVSGWAPSRGEYELQGIVVSNSDGKANWSTLAATGVDFAYLTASEGTDGRDKSFEANLNGVKQAGVRYGALHHFDICRLASDQATLFITTVPRDENALPPAVQLDFSDTCTGHPNRPLILSELATFLSQIEAHSGKPAVLMLSKEFEAEYEISKAIDRSVWLESTWFLPSYSARKWVMWTANTSRRISGIDRPVRWAVVRD
jgi:lysozyme